MELQDCPPMPTAAIHPVARMPDEWRTALATLGARPFVADQVFCWIHRKGVTDPRAMTNLPASLRGTLAADGLAPVADVADVRHSADGTRKLLVRLTDGATVESVLIRSAGPNRPTADERDGADDASLDADAASADTDDDPDEPSGSVRRVTQCISTQVGCAMGCVFCASGAAGLRRHLGPEEIVAQVLLGREALAEGERLRNVVLMGMGEPLHNYEATARALRLLTHPEGIGLSTRRVTVSTSGLVPEIERLGRDFAGQIALAVSLHAADDRTRSALMPINRRYGVGELVGALQRYPLPKRRRITIEYTLVAGKNDTVRDARALARLLRGVPVKINLIPMNPVADSPLVPSASAVVLAFQRVLTDEGYSCFVRRRRGDDVAAACGQLALLGARRKVRAPGAPR